MGIPGGSKQHGNKDQFFIFQQGKPTIGSPFGEGCSTTLIVSTVITFPKR